MATCLQGYFKAHPNTHDPISQGKEKNMATKEIQCTKCIHNEVCALKQDLLNMHEVVNESMNQICDLPFVYPIELKCKHYYSPVETRTYAYAAANTANSTYT